MLKAFHAKVASSFFLALITLVFSRPFNLELVLPETDSEPLMTDEGTVRSERSANISHIIGISRKIQIIVNKGMLLQMSPDGTVSGTGDDNDYTILQRVSVNNYQIKFQGVATCQFLCMDHCGLLYGSREFTDECIFNEMIESHFFNTYSSAKYSDDKRTLYLALNKKGLPRKVQTKAKASLGKLETYTNVLTKSVPAERVEALAMKILTGRFILGRIASDSNKESVGNHHFLRHHGYHQLCPNVPFTKLDEKNKFRCRKKEKRKKKRKCKENEDESDECQQILKKKANFTGKKKCEDGEEEEECQKRLHMIRKKRKSRNGESGDSNSRAVAVKKNSDDKKRKRRLKLEKKKFSEKLKCENSEGTNCVTKNPNQWSNNGSQSRTSGNSEFYSKVLSFSLPDIITTEKNTMVDYEMETTTSTTDSQESTHEYYGAVTESPYHWAATSAAVPAVRK